MKSRSAGLPQHRINPKITTVSGFRVKPEPVRRDARYDVDWNKLRARLIAKRGRVCQYPQHKGPSRQIPLDRRVIADHIVELSDGGSVLDDNNVMLMCDSCHQIKTGIARGHRVKESISFA